jgi:long-chain acyl-CoA synthetase
MQTLSEMLASSARHLPDRHFIISDEESLTFAEFNSKVAKLANVMASFGVKKEEPVGLYLPSCPRIPVGYYACQKLGAIAVPMSVMNRDREISAVVRATDMRVMLTAPATFPYAEEVRKKFGKPETLLTIGGAVEGGVNCDALMADAPADFSDVPCSPHDAAALFFTSGTTGEPKGAIHTQGSQYATLRDMGVFNRFRWADEVLLDALPLFNNFGATCMMNAAVFSGATIVMLERWDTERVLDGIARHKATYIAGSPTMFVYLLREYNPKRHDLSSLRLAVTGGAPVSPNIVEQFQHEVGVPLVEAYGSTEVTGYVTAEPVVGIRKRGSAGLPIGGTRIEIVDDHGKVLGPDEIGEVRISGDVVGGGYWRDPETTSRAFTPQGWLSGDLGYLDSDGYLYIVDRKKDVIISGGFNIYPLEVEDLLYTHPKVGVCALIGLPDEEKSEIPVAVVIPKAGETIDAKEIIGFCRAHVSAYKAPRAVYTLEEMPLGPSGKILKRKLRDWANEGKITEVK